MRKKQEVEKKLQSYNEHRETLHGIAAEQARGGHFPELLSTVIGLGTLKGRIEALEWVLNDTASGRRDSR